MTGPQYAAAGVDELRVNPMGATLDEQLTNLAHLLDLAGPLAPASPLRV